MSHIQSYLLMIGSYCPCYKVDGWKAQFCHIHIQDIAGYRPPLEIIMFPVDWPDDLRSADLSKCSIFYWPFSPIYSTYPLNTGGGGGGGGEYYPGHQHVSSCDALHQD